VRPPRRLRDQSADDFVDAQRGEMAGELDEHRNAEVSAALDLGDVTHAQAAEPREAHLRQARRATRGADGDGERRIERWHGRQRSAAEDGKRRICATLDIFFTHNDSHARLFDDRGYGFGLRRYSFAVL